METHLKSLDAIACEVQTDRASVFTRTYAKPHNYAVHYDKLFTPLRDKPIKLLEIGVGGGEGVRMWLDYFSNARIYGVDIVRNTNVWNCIGRSPITAPNYVFVHGSQSEDKFWNYFVSTHGGDWDICIDDGSHVNTDVITTFISLWPHVKPGGFYAIEDLVVSYGTGSMFVNPAWPSHVEFLKGKVDELNNGSGIDSIYFSKELCVIRKAL